MQIQTTKSIDVLDVLNQAIKDELNTLRDTMASALSTASSVRRSLHNTDTNRKSTRGIFYISAEDSREEWNQLINAKRHSRGQRLHRIQHSLLHVLSVCRRVGVLGKYTNSSIQTHCTRVSEIYENNLSVMTNPYRST